MTHGPIQQSGQGSAVERCLQHARERCSVVRSNAALVTGVRPVSTSSLSVPGRSGTSRPAGRSFRGYSAGHTQASSRNSASSSGLCKEQWIDNRSDCDARSGRVSEYSEKAWLSRAKRPARFRFALTMCLIACTIQSSRRPTAFWCPFESVPLGAV
jgi:hypothetical protein